MPDIYPNGMYRLSMNNHLHFIDWMNWQYLPVGGIGQTTVLSDHAVDLWSATIGQPRRL